MLYNSLAAEYALVLKATGAKSILFSFSKQGPASSKKGRDGLTKKFVSCLFSARLCIFLEAWQSIQIPIREKPKIVEKKSVELLCFRDMSS